eukprot:Filipodium_phascolosomae@DN7145_c0_g1_i1.p1
MVTSPKLEKARKHLADSGMFMYLSHWFFLEVVYAAFLPLMLKNWFTNWWIALATCVCLFTTYSSCLLTYFALYGLMAVFKQWAKSRKSSKWHSGKY